MQKPGKRTCCELVLGWRTSVDKVSDEVHAAPEDTPPAHLPARHNDSIPNGYKRFRTRPDRRRACARRPPPRPGGAIGHRPPCWRRGPREQDGSPGFKAAPPNLTEQQYGLR